MNNLLRFLGVCGLFLCSLVGAEIHHHELGEGKYLSLYYEWEGKAKSAFDELLISWNAARPNMGHFAIYVSVKTDAWSPWVLYAEWGSQGQRGVSAGGDKIKVYQDAVEVLDGKKGEEFRVRVVAEDGAPLDDFVAVHVCSSDIGTVKPAPFDRQVPSVSLPVPGLSQMALMDPRNDRICSPTSVTAVLRYLQQSNKVDPIRVAEGAWDAGFDIFGNWVFNTAEAYAQLGKGWSTWVSRLSGFDEIYDSLCEGMPVVISVRSPLPGSAKTYKSGHLIVVTGFDSETQEVLCMDPAFLTDGETHVRYALSDLMQAWERRKCIAYLFKKL